MSAVVAIAVAHHALLIALPFVVPALTLTFGVAVFAVRERRRRERGL